MLNQQDDAMPYTSAKDQKVLLVAFFYSSGDSSDCFGEKITSRFLFVLRHPETIYRIVKQPEKTESVCDKAAYLFVWKNYLVQ
jgi:hypothetical protein